MYNRVILPFLNQRVSALHTGVLKHKWPNEQFLLRRTVQPAAVITVSESRRVRRF